MSPRFILWLCVGVLLCFAPQAAVSSAQEPLHEAIDRLVSAQAGGPLAARSGDAEFLRRVYLDLAGRIPTVVELASFSPSKASISAPGLSTACWPAPIIRGGCASCSMPC
jgi:hypothetical protein